VSGLRTRWLGAAVVASLALGLLAVGLWEAFGDPSESSGESNWADDTPGFATFLLFFLAFVAGALWAGRPLMRLVRPSGRRF
jgi:hypothetical protein